MRYWVLFQGHSQRSAAKQFGVSRDTVGRMLLEAPQVPERRYQRGIPFPTTVRDLVLPYIDGWMHENAQVQRWAPKQRWTAHRMWVELNQMELVVAESTVWQLVRERKGEMVVVVATNDPPPALLLLGLMTSTQPASALVP